ncbi:MAG: LCP family protein [Oscillospiraceae bacterium]|nr:LCP family protein [Oscillospiraceae bacterium]
MALSIVFYILFAVAVGAALFLGWTMLSTGLLPQQVVIIVTCFMVLVPMILFLLQREKKGENKKKGLRIAGVVLLLFLSIVELTGLYFFGLAGRSLNKVTDGQTQIVRVEIFVRGDDNAQEIEYAVESEYRFGTIAYADPEAIQQARQELERQYGRQIKVQSYTSLQELIRALDEGEIDALLISSAYITLVDSLEGYEGYAESLRSLHASSIQSTVEPRTEPVQRELDPETAQALSDPDLWKDTVCAYVSGIDTYGPVNARSRSDVNIMTFINKETKTVLLISTPRDYYVPFNFVGGPLDKLTHAGVYGIDASMQALGDYYCLPLDYYVRVNFTGFIDIIDTLGGVDVEYDPNYGGDEFYFQDGKAHMGGKQALKFVRDRHSFIDGDRARGRHQMAVIKGVIKGLISSKLITNYAEIMEELSDSFQTNAPKALIGELVRLTMDRSKGDWNVLTYSANGVGTTDYAYSLGAYAYVMIPDEDTIDYARSLVIAVASGETMTQAEVYANAPKR